MHVSKEVNVVSELDHDLFNGLVCVARDLFKYTLVQDLSHGNHSELIERQICRG